MKPPIANKQSHSFKIHGQTIYDDYHWLRDPKWTNVEDPKILDYLKAENKYTEDFFADLQSDKERIFEELKGRVKLDDESVYIKKEDYYYYTRLEGDKNYPIYCRKYQTIVNSDEFCDRREEQSLYNNRRKGEQQSIKFKSVCYMQAEEEIILDTNLLNPAGNFTDVGEVSMSSDQNLMAYSVNFTGSEKYDIKIYNLEEQKYLSDEIKEVAPTIIWHEKLNGFFYITINENQRWDKVMFHYLGEEAANDKLIFAVKNPLHFVSSEKSSSREYLFINSGDHNENEIYVISMQDDSFTPKLVRPAENRIFYELTHNSNYFYIKTNYKAKNFRIVKVPVDNFENNSWNDDYIKEEQDKYLKDFDITKDYLILNYRNNGLPLVKVKRLRDSAEKITSFPDASFQASSYSTNFEEDDIRINYSSLARPNTIYSYDFDSEKLTILKEQEIPSGFNSDEYKIERIFADNEGVKIPITLFYKKSLFKKDGSNPLYLMGYGAYGIAMPVNFRSMAVSLADRGFTYAVAHIRGGDDLGHDWYEAAKFLTKKRTFEDFIACSETLIREKYTSINNIVIMGGSAGGMLIGYVINEKPKINFLNNEANKEEFVGDMRALATAAYKKVREDASIGSTHKLPLEASYYRAAIGHVPFVDVLNTMLDETLPLTPIEYNEWGNPQQQEYFDYIKSYSPYDNVKPQNYPALYVTCGLSDPRVGYWEPAKWVAKLRTLKTDNNPLLLKTNMDTGHKGSSGRFDYLKETAEELVFIFKVFGIISM